MTKINPKSTPLRLSDLSSKGWTADPHKAFLLWYEAISLSPSYELARRYRLAGNKLSQSDKARVPSDFEKVLKVYDDFGDVQRTFFREWWLDRGIRLFGSLGNRPKTQPLCMVSEKTVLDTEKIRHIQRYFDSAWLEQNKPEVLVVSIPMNIGKTKALREVKKLIDQHAVAPTVTQPPKYALTNKDVHHKSILDAISVLYMKAAYPDYKLWQIGVVSGISKTYSPQFDVQKTKRNIKNSEELRHLEMMTSRKFRQARYLAENAARGLFPVLTKPEIAVEFDAHEFKKVLLEKIRWRKANKQ